MGIPNLYTVYIYMENLYGKSWKNLLLKWMILGVTPLLPFQETAHLRIYHGIASSLEWDGWILADFARAYVVPPCNNDQLNGWKIQTTDNINWTDIIMSNLFACLLICGFVE